jgi:hypothetical protein
VTIAANYAFDLRSVEAENDRLLHDSPEHQQLLRLVNAAINMIAAIPVDCEQHPPSELALFRLMIRLMNSAIGSLHLARGGLYQQSVALLRDVMETTFLLDLFASDSAELQRWIEMPAEEREKHFKPWKVRKKLDERDGFQQQKRKAAYRMLSSYGAHPTPEGFSVISPDNMTALGPFPSAPRFKALVEEAALRVTEGALTCLKHAGRARPDLHEKRDVFLPLVQWLMERRSPYSAGGTTPPP